MPIQTARPSHTLSYRAVSMTSQSWVYPRMICCIHRLAREPEGTIVRIKKNRSCHLQISKLVLFRCCSCSLHRLFCFGVLAQSKYNFTMACCSVRYADVALSGVFIIVFRHVLAVISNNTKNNDFFFIATQFNTIMTMNFDSKLT